MIEKPAAVEDDVADACCLGALSDEQPRSLGLGRLIAGLDRARIGGREGGARHVVDHLHVDIGIGSEDGQARTRGGTGNRAAHPTVATLSCLDWSHFAHGVPRTLRALADLSDHVLADVSNALALVGLWRSELSDFRGDLADALLVDAAHDDLRGLRHLELDSLRRDVLDSVRVPERELEVLALCLTAVTDTLNLELLLVPVRDTLDHVGDEGARESVKSAMVRTIGWALDCDDTLVDNDLHVGVDVLLERPLRTGHGDAPRGDLDRDSGWNVDDAAANSTHEITR